MATQEHSRLIAKVAKAALAPMGLRQKGRSRTWLDDQAWWVGIVEFQPSGWSKGSGVNVGGCLLWSHKGFLSFDFLAHRDLGFARFVSPEQFQSEIERLAHDAKRAIEGQREQIGSVDRVVETLKASRLSPPWLDLHAGIGSGLTGDPTAAADHFGRVMAEESAEAPWLDELKRQTRELRSFLEDAPAFRAAVRSRIHRERRSLGLAEIPDLELERRLVDCRGSGQ